MENMPQMKMRSPENPPVFEPKQALAQEKTGLERFSGMSKKVARVMLLVSALSVAPGVVSQANAQETKAPGAKIEQVQKNQEEKIDESKLTESSKWSKSIIESARADMAKIKTQEDANWLIRSHFGPFVSEYYMPTKGDIKEGAYGTKTRDYTQEDSRFLLQGAKEMKKIVEELNTKFKVEAYSDRIEQIDKLITHLESKSSYAGQKQSELLKRMLEKYK